MSDKLSEREKFFIRMAANLLKPCRYDEDKAWAKVRRQTIGRSIQSFNYRWLKYVAVFVAGIGVALWGYRMQVEILPAETREVSVVRPADRQAELILASGQRLILADSVGGREVLHSGMSVHIDSNNQRLEYNSVTIPDQKITGYNTLRVPKGGEYALVLPDGTEVRLNSESSLRFPVAFEKGKREVYLEGEAFFNVSPDRESPFHVYAGGRDVCVLGTSFDVYAYADELCFLSTLVSGKVKVSGGRDEVVLQPFEQYSENYRTGMIEVKTVDAGLSTSWLNGKIRFKNERLEDIIKKLGRWFEFEIFYASEEVKDMKFRGVINKYDSFNTVLKYLEQTTDIRFSIQGNTIVARKINNN